MLLLAVVACGSQPSETNTIDSGEDVTDSMFGADIINVETSVTDAFNGDDSGEPSFDALGSDVWTSDGGLADVSSDVVSEDVASDVTIEVDAGEADVTNADAFSSDVGTPDSAVLDAGRADSSHDGGVTDVVCGDARVVPDAIVDSGDPTGCESRYASCIAGCESCTYGGCGDDGGCAFGCKRALSICLSDAGCSSDAARPKCGH